MTAPPRIQPPLSLYETRSLIFQNESDGSLEALQVTNNISMASDQNERQATSRFGRYMYPRYMCTRDMQATIDND